MPQPRYNLPYYLSPEQARRRHRTIAKSYAKAPPTLGNLFNAAKHYLKGIGVLEAEGTGVQTGIAPTAKIIGNVNKYYKAKEISKAIDRHINGRIKYANPLSNNNHVLYLKNNKNIPFSNTVYTGVPKKYVESFPTYSGEIWAGPTEQAVQGYAKNGKVFPIRYDTNNIRIIDTNSKGKISEKGIKLSEVPNDILQLYNNDGIKESPIYMSLYNLSKYANKIKPTIVRARNVKDAKKGVFDYTIIGENVPRKVVYKEPKYGFEFYKYGGTIYLNPIKYRKRG